MGGLSQLPATVHTQAFALDTVQALLQQWEVFGTAEQGQAAGIKLVHRGSPISVSRSNMGAREALYKGQPRAN